MINLSRFGLFLLLALCLCLAPACGPSVKPEEAPPPEALLKTPPEEEPATEPPAPEPVKPVRKPSRIEKPVAKPKPATKPEPRPEPKPEPIVEAKPEPKPEPKPEVKPEPKPEPETTVKPEAEPSAREPVLAKEEKERKYWMGLYAGGAKLWGGVWNLSTVGPQGGVLFRYHPDGKKLGFGLDLAYARFYCYEDIFEPEASEYKTDMILAGLTATYDLLPGSTLSPYSSLHAGFTNWNNQMPPVYAGQPMMDWGDPASNIKGTNLHLGLALGLRARVSSGVSLFVEGRGGLMPNDKMNVGHHDANNMTSAVVAGAMFGF
ncbi:MAG TPA: hypothetical protein DDW31_07780 [candidate division Zixibacteria bacterium]|nr:hypothetical protein [candidate division Zixibacteria bacterium]